MSDQKIFSRGEKGSGACSRYLKSHDGRDFYVPLDLIERFYYLEGKRKIQDGEYIESKRGHTIMFSGEFGKYEIILKKGQIWQGVKIKKINGDFVYYRRVKKIFGFSFSFGQIYILNKWSFFRIFVSGANPGG